MIFFLRLCLFLAPSLAITCTADGRDKYNTVSIMIHPNLRGGKGRCFKSRCNSNQIFAGDLAFIL